MEVTYRFQFVSILLLASFLSVSCGSKILGLFPHPGFSHFKSFSPVFQALAERGHNVTLVTYFPAKKPHPNYNEVILKGAHPLNSFDFDMIQPSTAIRKAWRDFFLLQRFAKEACTVFFESNAVELILESHADAPFDLIIVEIFNTDCTLGLAHLLDKPIVALSSCVLMPWHYNRVGLPDFPSYIPSQFAGYADDMVYWERLLSFIATHSMKLLYRTTELMDNDLIRKYLNIDVDVQLLAKKTSLVLINEHYSINGARPLSTRVVDVGGIHISAKSKSLPQDLKKFLNESRDGVIFISWGSLVKSSSLPTDKIIGMVNAMKKLKERIIWKWDGETKPVESNQFFIANWVQQKDVLCTENSNNDMIREYLNLDIDVRDIAKNVSLILVNQHFSILGSRPLSTRVVEVGGMHISNKSESLPQDLENFLNESRDGVIFISWGSLVKASSLPNAKVIGMVNAMKKLKERIVWKWDGETKPVESDKFFVTNWVQQKDILCKYMK